MTITSLEFLGFCLISILVFIVFPRKYRWIALLLSSIAFYWISARGGVIVFIVMTSLTIWLTGRILDLIRIKSEIEVQNPELGKEAKRKIRKKEAKQRKLVLGGALIVNIGLLVIFKIFNHFTAAFIFIVGIFMGERGESVSHLIMPLGISYYTFSTVGYLLDVYWKRYESEKNPIRFFLYTIYFPHILQGPISRYTKLGQELKKTELYFTWDNFVLGMESILLGCFKKLVIADRASIFVSNTLLTNELHGSIYFLAMVLDAIQIYSDFSGYMDIVSGVSKMFDIELEKNFNHPFLAKSVPEFWRRWHMSLGSWFKDYVYYPITVSKRVKSLNKKIRGLRSVHLKTLAGAIIPIMVTWLLTGLWHGTGQGYIAWGIYYGTLIVLSVVFSDDIQKLLQKCHVNTECFSYRIFQTLKIFCIFMGGRFLGTRMPMPHRIEIIRQIFTSFVDFSIYDYGLDRVNFRIIVYGVMVLIAIAAIEGKEDLFSWFNRQNKIFCAFVLYGMFFAVFLLGIYGTAYDTSNFMYQQF